MQHCNGRNRGTRANGKPKVDTGTWKGAGYCKLPVAWGVPEAADGRCKRHGGLSLKGAAHPRATDLRRSKYVPKWLLEDFEASLARVNQLTLDEQIATIDARIAEVFRGMPEGAGPGLWDEVGRSLDLFEAAVRAQDKAAAGLAQAELRSAVDGGRTYASSWADLYELGELRRKLVATESLRMQRLEDSVTRSRLGTLVIFMAAGITRAIQENVSSETERRRALTQVASFMHTLALGHGQEPVEVPAEEET